MTQENVPFDDPGLKAAIRRLRGGHAASPELAQRVAAALAAAPDADSLPDDNSPPHTDSPPDPDATEAPTPLRPAQRWVRRLAVAASVLLFVGAVGALLKVRHDRHEAEEYLGANAGLLREMAEAHAAGMPSGPAVQVLSAADGSAAVRDRAAGRLSRYVPLPDLSPYGWTLSAAAVTPFGSSAAPAGRFEFTGAGSRRLTLLSLPATAFTGAEEGAEYQTTIQGCPIAGFVSQRGIHCIVGDPGTSVADVVALRDRLRRS
jgi:anti-sigma factor RsiW